MVVSRDSKLWTKEVLDELFHKYPQLTGKPVKLTFIKQDKERGYGVGAIALSANMAVPVIIDSYYLYPFDVIFVDNAPIPLTRETSNIIFTNPSAFMDIDRRVTDDSVEEIFSRGLSEIRPRYQKTSSVLDYVSSNVEDKERLQSAILKHAETYTYTGNIDVLERIEKVAEHIKPADLDSRLRYNMDFNIVLMKKASRNKYKLRMGRTGIDYKLDKHITEKQANALKENYGTSYFKTASKITRTPRASYEILDSPGQYLYIDKCGNYFAKLTKNTKNCYTPELSVPKVDDYGVLKIGNKVTKPIKLSSVMLTPGSSEIQGYDDLQTKYSFFINKNINKPIPHELIKNAYYIPEAKSGFIALSNPVKESKPKITIRSSNYVIKTGSTYAFNGPIFRSYLKDKINNLDELDARWSAAVCGATKAEIDKLANLKSGETAYFKKVKTPKNFEKVYEKLSTSYKTARNNVPINNIVKIAAYIEDKTTVDAMLSLGLVNKDNVMEFVEKLPMFEQAASYLAKLLLLVRIGLKSIPERELRKAVEGLGIIVEILRSISMRQINAK